jgi:murein DD-endopeptidase MepM/ murein hydrolase activator NlpD
VPLGRPTPRDGGPPPTPEPAPPNPAPPPPASGKGITFPTGNITTRNLRGVPYNTPWADIARWEPWFTEATAKAGGAFGPLLLACFVVVESQGKHFTHNRTTGTDAEVIKGNADPRSRGMLQIRHDLHDPQMRALQPREQIRLGARLLTQWMRETGSWEAALAQKWHPGTDPGSGIGPPAYIRIIRDLIAEVKAGWPDQPPASTSTDDPLRVMFGGKAGTPNFGFRDSGGVGYAYGVNHGTTSADQHTGVDVPMPRGTPIVAPLPGVITCVGEAGPSTWGQGCGFYNDTGDLGPGGPILGIGNISLLTDAGIKIVFGHSSKAFVTPGQRVKAGERIGLSGGMLGPHIHLEVATDAPERVPAKDRARGLTYWLVDPLPAIAEAATRGSPVVTPTSGQSYAVAGLSQPITLPFPLKVALIPVSQTNQRPGQRMTPDRYVQHDTGNRNRGANAAMHLRYLQNGAEGQQLGYHFTVDDREAYQMIPVNEITWHGGDSGGPCNMRGVSCELCINSDIDIPKSRENAAILAAEVSNAMTLTLHKHQDCAGKLCPQDMLNAGMWPWFEDRVSALRQKRR